MAKKVAGTLIIIVFFGVFLGFGLIALYIAIEGAYYGAKSESWSVAEAVIDESRIKTRKRKKAKKKRSLVVKYHYQVEGSRYYGDKVQYLDNMFYPKSKKQWVVSHYPRGQRVQVYYDPTNPERSVLITSFEMWSLLGGLGVGLLFSGIGIFGLKFVRRR